MYSEVEDGFTFPVVVHVILGSDLTFPETYFFDELLNASLAIVLEE